MPEMTVRTGTGKLMNAKALTPEEVAIFEREYPIIMRPFSSYTKGDANMNMQNAWYDLPEVKAAVKLACENAKADLQPSAGIFGGMNATSGFGWTPIYADLLVPTAQGRTYETTIAVTAHNWYGLYHNAAIGAAYNASPLYLRKEVAVMMLGLIELSGNPIAEGFQIELNSQPQAIQHLNYHMLGGDLPMYFFSEPYYLKPSQFYRSHFQSAVAAATFNLQPIGVAFQTAPFMMSTANTQPSVTAP